MGCCDVAEDSLSPVCFLSLFGAEWGGVGWSRVGGLFKAELSPKRYWETICLSLHRHHQNDFCIKMGSDESQFKVLPHLHAPFPRP